MNNFENNNNENKNFINNLISKSNDYHTTNPDLFRID